MNQQAESWEIGGENRTRKQVRGNRAIETIETKTVTTPDEKRAITPPPASGSRPSRRSAKHPAISFAAALQEALAPDQLIGIFSRHIQTLVPHSGLRFDPEPPGIPIACGGRDAHDCAFRLAISGQTLGDIRFFRAHPFNRTERTALEALLGDLIHPLRNAIMYRCAVTAALTDPLTGINNRSAMNSALIRATEFARGHDRPLTLIRVDIDHLALINEQHGRVAGDDVLQRFAALLGACVRRSDALFRCDGDDFLLILSDTARREARTLAERIRRRIATHGWQWRERLIPLSASLGIACCGGDDDSETLFDKADRALDAARAAGRNCVKVCA